MSSDSDEPPSPLPPPSPNNQQIKYFVSNQISGCTNESHSKRSNSDKKPRQSLRVRALSIADKVVDTVYRFGSVDEEDNEELRTKRRLEAEQRAKPLLSLTEVDGAEIGDKVYAITQTIKSNRSKLRDDLLGFIRSYPDSLGVLNSTNPFILPMLIELFAFNLVATERKPNSSKVTPLEAKAELRGKTLGAALRISILVSLTSSAATEKFISQNAEIKALADQYPFFQPMILRIAGNIATGRGMKYRLGFAVMLTYMDVFSDFLMIRQYYKEGNTLSFNLCLSIMIIHTIIQIFSNFLQNSKHQKYVLKELFLILLYLKPVVDLFRIISGESKKSHQKMHALDAMMISKQIEVVFEAVPQTLVQVVALILTYRGNKEFTTIAVTSIIISALSAGYSQAVVGFSGDVDPERRKFGSSVYGYVPVDGIRRLAVIFFGTVFGTCQLLIRSFALGMVCVSVGVPALLLVLSLEFSLMLLGIWYFNGSFYYWVPVRSDSFAIALALFCRFVDYVATSNSPIMQLRHPFELGGRVFSLTMMMSVVSSWIMWFVVHGNTEDGRSIPGASFLAVLTSLYALGWIGFLRTISRTHIFTFWSTTNGREYVECYWIDQPDEIRWFAACGVHDSMRPPVDEIKKWAGEGWKRWTTEKPRWFVNNREQLLDLLPEGSLVLVGLETDQKRSAGRDLEVFRTVSLARNKLIKSLKSRNLEARANKATSTEFSINEYVEQSKSRRKIGVVDETK